MMKSQLKFEGHTPGPQTFKWLCRLNESGNIELWNLSYHSPRISMKGTCVVEAPTLGEAMRMAKRILPSDGSGWI